MCVCVCISVVRDAGRGRKRVDMEGGREGGSETQQHE